jgi:TfoX/Sxy family transcriptional regulator of competence genes
MAYDTFLAERIQRLLDEKRVPNFGKKMFGGICFMVDDKMLAGVMHDELMVRIDPERQEEALKLPDTSLMDTSGKSMKGFIMVGPEAVDMEEDLEYWINLALEFNPRAKSSKK